MMITWPRFSIIESIVLLRDADNRMSLVRGSWLLKFYFLSLSFSFSSWPTISGFASFTLSSKSLFSRVRCDRKARIEIFQCKSGAISSNQIIEFRFDWNGKWNYAKSSDRSAGQPLIEINPGSSARNFRSGQPTVVAIVKNTVPYIYVVTILFPTNQSIGSYIRSRSARYMCSSLEELGKTWW